MRRLRLLQLLLILALWTRLSNSATTKTCLCDKVGKLKGLHPDRPCNECATGHYRSCTGGAYYAHHPTMCIYATRQEDFTHEAANDWCTKYDDGAGFLAFVGSLEESYDISHFVWNSLKNGVQGNETFFWLGGKIKRYHTSETFWLFEYSGGYYDVVPRELLPDNATLEQAILEGRTCLAGHTENHTKLYPRDCNEKLPAVCYNYRQTAKLVCEQVDGKVWNLFQGKCYYVYSAPTRDRTKDYKTYFDAQRECGEMGAILATVTDYATFKRTLDLAAGLEKIVDLDEGTWIGLQVGTKGIYYYANGTGRPFTDFPKGKSDGALTGGKDFRGAWEDGTPYDNDALYWYWAKWADVNYYEPNEYELRREHGSCENATNVPQHPPNNVNRVRCDKDDRQHCTQIFPGSTEKIPDCEVCKDFGNKWNDRWCYYLQRGYICQRDAVFGKDLQRMKDEL